MSAPRPLDARSTTDCPHFDGALARLVTELARQAAAEAFAVAANGADAHENDVNAAPTPTMANPPSAPPCMSCCGARTVGKRS